MAAHRVLCIKLPKITYNPNIQRQLSNQLMILEWIVMIFLALLNLSRIWMIDTNLGMAFCRGHSMEMDLILIQGDF